MNGTTPLPARVGDRADFWANAHRTRSERCIAWEARIRAGWRPNRRLSQMGWEEKAKWYGVYNWEYIEVLAPLLTKGT